MTRDSFEAKLTDLYSDIEIVNRTDVRWWMAAGMHTNETILEELHAMYRGGFSGVELCQLADRTIDGALYGYGSTQWENDVKLILNTALDLGMSVSLTSGAGWSTANVPGLDPDSQKANQCIVLLTEDLGAGCRREGSLPIDKNLREKASFVGVVAVKRAGETVYHADGYVDLTALVRDGALEWTAPDGGDYTLMYYFAQGTCQAASPAVETSYTINYFDRRGFEALKAYLETNVLNDEALNAKIKEGNVQFFMDSLEYHNGRGITNWTETFPEQFRARKGYDILPYLFLAKDAPVTSIWGWSDNADLVGSLRLTDEVLSKKILNDIFDVQTKLYLEEFIAPFRAWLHTYGIKLRAQISYGKNLEISEPIAFVDFPEAENRNQNNQVDMYRLWSGGAHLQNKILSSETGGLDNSAYSYTYQKHLQEAYALYSAGYSRIVWHIWSAPYGPKPVWPGYEGGDGKHIYYKFGTREPSCSEYAEFNDHLGRIQKLLRRGKAGVDIGMPYIKYGQHLVYRDEKDWMHTHRPMFFPSTCLQDNGYTYDYFTPELLRAEGVYFDKNAKTLECAGYKALVLWQEVLSSVGAEAILSLARDGLPVVILKGAALRSPYGGADDAELRVRMDALRSLENVVCAEDAEAVLAALKDFGIHPYVGFSSANRQLLTQTRREGEDRYVFVYNYCDGSLHDETNLPHGDSISATLTVDGSFVPYAVDAWTGSVKKVSRYRHEKGKTLFDLSLKYGDVALFALQASSSEDLPAACEAETPAEAPFEIAHWDLTVESVVPTDRLLTRRETLLGVTTEEYSYDTEKDLLHTSLEHLETWDKIEAIGPNVSGKGYYRSTFRWSGACKGAKLDFGKITQSMQVFINGKKTDNINMNVPCVDISPLLRVGENVIEVHYSSNLNNLQLSRGVIRAHVLPSGFLGYETGYESYGLRKATVIPY